MSGEGHRWVIIDELVISFTEVGPSRDAVWHAFVNDLISRRVTKYLATSIGSVNVNSVQRKIVSEALKQRNVAVAAVTDDRLVRGLVTAVAWLGVNIKPFSWSEIGEAVNYLNISPAKTERIIRAAIQLREGATK